jgi:methylmalonyl-CoA mutase cobalamin-binding domain/chain
MAGMLSEAIIELARDKVLDMVKTRVEKGDDPVSIVDECRRGMTAVGDKYQKGEYFLAELMLAAEIFKNAVSLLKPYLRKTAQPKKMGKMVLATLKGDIHDLGKDIFAVLLDTHGFEVHNLGIDVDPGVVVKKVKEVKPDFVGFSALMTTTFPVMKSVIETLGKEGLRKKVKLMIGGGVTTQAVAEFVGADFQTTDALEGVNYCKKMAGGK